MKNYIFRRKLVMFLVVGWVPSHTLGPKHNHASRKDKPLNGRGRSGYSKARNDGAEISNKLEGNEKGKESGLNIEVGLQ